MGDLKGNCSRNNVSSVSWLRNLRLPDEVAFQIQKLLLWVLKLTIAESQEIERAFFKLPSLFLMFLGGKSFNR